MDKTLSIVLPVHNEEDAIAEKVERVLDFLSDVTSEFEVLIVDNASSDETEEVARGFASRFPQVNVIRTESTVELASTLSLAKSTAKGDRLFVHQGRAPMRLEEITRKLTGESDVRPSETAAAGERFPKPGGEPFDDALVERLIHWGEGIRRIDAGALSNDVSKSEQVDSPSPAEAHACANASAMDQNRGSGISSLNSTIDAASRPHPSGKWSRLVGGELSGETQSQREMIPANGAADAFTSGQKRIENDEKLEIWF